MNLKKKEMEKQKPKPEWWRQYKVGDKIDLIGVEIVNIDEDDADSRLTIKDVTLDGGTTYLYFDDRHIRPHDPTGGDFIVS